MRISWEEYCWISDAVGYDQVSTVSSAYQKLLQFREMIEHSGSLTVHTKVPVLLHSVNEFDNWVRQEFPVFIDDPLHPVFNVR